MENLLVAFLFVEEGVFVLETGFFIFFTLEIGIAEENFSV